MKRLLLSSLLLRHSAAATFVAALALAALALPARADFGLTVNGDDIADASGTGWTFDGVTVSLTNAGPFVLSTTGESSFTSNVAVVAQADCAVTFSHIEVFAANHSGLSPFTVAPGVSVALTLDGNAVLRAGDGAAAITVVSNASGVASLTIDADATDTFHTLGATGGKQGAGIGGGDGETCGSVTINGGVLTVQGGANAAGIGGGRNGAGGTVTISGGRLNVQSAGSLSFGAGGLTTVNGGAAIGGGYNGAGGMTAISGGTVSLSGVGGGAAVGPGKDGAGGTTAITGGSILASGGAAEPSPSNGVARVWPVAVSNLTAGAAVELPWLPATYGTNDLVATAGGEVCVWLPTGDYAYGEVESDGAGGMRRHAVLVDAEGNVTLDGWVASAYAVWAGTNGIAGTWNDTDALGIYNVFRYAFDETNAIPDPPLLSIAFDADGRPLVLTPPLVNTEGFDLSILATEDVAGISNAVDFALDPSGTNAIPASAGPSRFFRLKAEEQ